MKTPIGMGSPNTIPENQLFAPEPNHHLAPVGSQLHYVSKLSHRDRVSRSPLDSSWRRRGLGLRVLIQADLLFTTCNLPLLLRSNITPHSVLSTWSTGSQFPTPSGGRESRNISTVSVDYKSACKMAEDLCLKKYLRQCFQEEGPYVPQNYCQLTCCLNTDLPFYPQTLISIPSLHVISRFQQKFALLWNVIHPEAKKVNV